MKPFTRQNILLQFTLQRKNLQQKLRKKNVILIQLTSLPTPVYIKQINVIKNMNEAEIL